MALERSDPIPPGVYYVDLIGPDGAPDPERVAHFQDWIRRWSEAGERVKGLRSTETFRLFQVFHPTPRWSVEARLGFPTRAPRGASTTREDISDRPEPEPDILDTAQGFLSGVSGMGLGVLLLLFVFMKRK